MIKTNMTKNMPILTINIRIKKKMSTVFTEVHQRCTNLQNTESKLFSYDLSDLHLNHHYSRLP